MNFSFGGSFVTLSFIDRCHFNIIYKHHFEKIYIILKKLILLFEYAKGIYLYRKKLE